MNIARREIDWLVEYLEAGHQVSLSRWGDGEWRSVCGIGRNANCDGHTFFPEMGEELAEVLRSRPRYLLGMQQLALRHYGEPIAEFIEGNQLTDVDWLDADLLHRASIKGRLAPFITLLRSRPLILVGPAHLEGVAGELTASRFIEVPSRDCYLETDRIVAETLDAASALPPGGIVSVSASMPANLIIDRLDAEIGELHSLLDVGSVWDVFAGVRSRSYMANMDASLSESGRS